MRDGESQEYLDAPQANNRERTSNAVPTIATKRKIEGCQITATIHHPLSNSESSITSSTSLHALKPIHFGINEIAFIDE